MELLACEQLFRLAASRPLVFRVVAPGFGDCWAVASIFSALTSIGCRILLTHDGGTLDARIPEIGRHLRVCFSAESVCTVPDVLIAPTSDMQAISKSTDSLPRYGVVLAELFRVPYQGTKVRWRPNASSRIACHFTARRRGPSEVDKIDLSAFRRQAVSCGYTLVELGAHLSIDQNIVAASESLMFVGIDSGLSHLAHSVGVPVHLIRNHLPLHHVRSTHFAQKYSVYANLADLMTKTGISQPLKAGLHGLN